MKRLLVIPLILIGCDICAAQYGPQGGLELFYQRVQGFDYRSGSPDFDLQGANLNGGGFGIVYNITDLFGFWSQTGFYSGAKQRDIDLKLINQLQGVKLTKRDLGAFNFYVKGGIGFTRYVFETSQFETVSYSQSFSYGGGTEIRIGEGLYLILDISQMAMGLPDITGSPDRDKWDSALLITSGISLNF